MVWIQFAVRVGVVAVAFSLAVVVANAPAVAAPRPITGELSRSGYTVLALAADGEARVVRARRGRFRLRPPSERVTLHLRAPNGGYAGPIVVAREQRGRRAVVGVRAGARLDRVRVGRGYATVSRRPRRTWVDATRRARARRGVPIGAGNFGRVRSRPVRGAVPGDLDLDGIPDPLDIDDDGDLVLDDLDRSARARAAQVLQEPLVTSFLVLDAHQTVNASPRHAADPSRPAFTDQEIDAALSGPGGRLIFAIPPTGSTELDCGRDDPATPGREGLVYCSGGTPPSTGVANAGRFPDCCDPDNDGFGTLPGLDRPRDLTHGATSAQIKTGQTLIQHVTLAGPESQCPPPAGTSNPNCASFPTTLQYIFSTVPALASYDDGQGNSVTVQYPQVGGGGLLPVSARPDGNVVVTLTFWRPQRRPAPGEPGYSDPPTAWTDIGHLNYTAAGAPAGAPTTPPQPPSNCPQSAFSTTDPNLTPFSEGGLTDLADDQPADQANTFTYTLNLTQCLTSPWNVGETRRFHFVASPQSGGGFAEHIVQFRRQ